MMSTQHIVNRGARHFQKCLAPVRPDCLPLVQENPMAFLFTIGVSAALSLVVMYVYQMWLVLGEDHILF